MAKQWTTLHDANWQTREQKETLVKISQFLTKETWKRMPAPVIERELKAGVPCFWRHFRKNFKSKSALLKAAKPSDTYKTNFGLFLKLVDKIGDKKAENIISTKARAKVLNSPNVTRCDLLAEFIKADQSEWLANAEEEEEDAIEKVRSVIASNGAEISNHKRWQAQGGEIIQQTIDFHLTCAYHSDDEVDNDDVDMISGEVTEENRGRAGRND